MANAADGAEFLDGLNVPAWTFTNPPDDGLVPEETTVTEPRKNGHARPTPAPALQLDSMNRNPIQWNNLAGKEPPERHWAIPGWFGYGHVTLLAGSGGIGKSLIAQQLASCLSTGTQFIGEPQGRVRVLGWLCEDDHDEIWRRQVAIAQWLNADLADFKDLIVMPRHGMENTLADDEGSRLLFSPLMEELHAQANDYAADVLILDNIAQLYGGKESDRHQVTQFLNRLAGDHPGRAILLLGHPGKALGSEYSGSTAWEACVRTRLYLGDVLPDQKAEEGSEPPDSTVRYLCRRKANYSSKDWRQFNYQDGVLVPQSDDPAGGMVDHLRAQKAERIVCSGLKKLLEIGKEPTDQPTAKDRYLPRLIQQNKLSEGCTRNELENAMRDLVMSGRIKIAEVGKYSNRAPKKGLILTT